MMVDTDIVILPEKFLQRAMIFCGDEYDLFKKSFLDKPPVSIRLNPFKKSDKFADEEKIKWSVNGRYLDERPSFTLDPLFHAGCYYVQDASSQFLEQVFLHATKNLESPLRVLDLCAAPGGKSTHILSLLGDDDLLVCNEVISSRNSVLRYNIMKWGKENVIVTQNNPSDFEKMEEFFDVVIVDAPCSGEGLFRKDKNAVNEWSEENVLRCSVRQQEILRHAYKTTKPGGYIIYSTCTYEEIENDLQAEILADKLMMKPVSIPMDFKGVIKTKYGLEFLPHRVRGEGFYISLLKKEGQSESSSKKVTIKTDPELLKPLRKHITDHDKYYPLYKFDRLFAIPNSHYISFQNIVKNLYVRLAGIYMGEFKKEDFIPSAALALSVRMKDVSSEELNEADALKYLRGEKLNLKLIDGWTVAKYKHFNLGWMKNIGSRINNYYPKEWRIKNL